MSNPILSHQTGIINSLAALRNWIHTASSPNVAKSFLYLLKVFTVSFIEKLLSNAPDSVTKLRVEYIAKINIIVAIIAWA